MAKNIFSLSLQRFCCFRGTNMNMDHEVIESFDDDEVETVDATESTQGRAGGSIMEVGAWVYKR
jgi:hypothetical protein